MPHFFLYLFSNGCIQSHGVFKSRQRQRQPYVTLRQHTYGPWHQRQVSSFSRSSSRLRENSVCCGVHRTSGGTGLSRQHSSAPLVWIAAPFPCAALDFQVRKDTVVVSGTDMHRALDAPLTLRAARSFWRSTDTRHSFARRSASRAALREARSGLHPDPHLWARAVLEHDVLEVSVLGVGHKKKCHPGSTFSCRVS